MQNRAKTVLYAVSTVLPVALSVLYLALTVLYLPWTVLYPALTVLYLPLTVLHLALREDLEDELARELEDFVALLQPRRGRGPQEDLVSGFGV